MPELQRGAHRDTLDASAPQPFQLTPVVVPGSERILVDAVPLDSSRYQIDYRFGRLWIEDLEGEEEIVAVYWTLPFRFKDAYRLHTIAPADTAPAPDVPVPQEDERAVAFRAPSRLQHSGSITRGILAGNNRDVTVESGLRMQLSGEIVDGVDVQAVLTDENTPILPEGTTQRIEEFDRVFIGIDAPYGSAQLGDFDLRFASSEFAPFARKLQGATVDVPLPEGGVLAGGHVAVAGATSRGTFRSQEIEPIDGVQGPYRLEGSEGERFVLVVPGSETVYVDGEQLTRGETNDYTIDYSTAEITFTPGVIVTSDKRIKVEFQYTSTQFTRTLVGSQVETRLWRTDDGSARARFGASVLREADSREFAEEFGFSREDSLVLAGAGDGPAQSDGAERVEFEPEAAYVHYRREVRGGDTVYIAIDRAPADSVAVYRVHFSRVGPDEGAYARVGRSINGILYEYRGPGAGDYLPVRILPKPIRQRVIDLHGGVEPLPGLELFGEWAQSIHDRNRLSSIGDEDDRGDAFVGGVRLRSVQVGPGRISGEMRRRFVAGNFASFNRIRPVEFERRWNLLSRGTTATGGIVGGGDELIDEGNLRVDLFEGTSLRGEVGRIELDDGFRGLRRAAYLASEEQGLPHLDYRLEWIGSRDALTEEEGHWIRQLGSLALPLLGGSLVPRLQVEHEDRRQRFMERDSLARPSFRFVELRPGARWDAGTLELGGYVELRREDDWLDGELREAATSWTGQTTFRYRPSSTFDMDGNVGFRSRRFTDPFRLEQNREDVESLILRLNTALRPLQRAVQLHWMYEGMTERTPTLQEIYVRTGPEIGQYVWEDASGDGLVQIDEMLPERLPNEGTYVKTFVPSDTLTSVLNVESRLRLELEPKRLWTAPDTPWQRWLSQVSTRTVVEVREKTRDPRLSRIYLLDLSRFRDAEHTMNGRLRLGQDVFLFRGRPNYGLDVSFSQLRSLSELAAGEEERFVNSWRAEGRLRHGSAWGFRTMAAIEQDRLLSDTFVSRRYDIEALRLEPEVSFSASRSIQLVGSFALGRKRDDLGDRRARVLKLPLEIRYSRPRKLQLTARVEVADVDMVGDALGLAQYELTDGRGPGTSYLWTLRGQYTVNEYLRATFSYDGRAPSGAPVVHTMQMQLSAIF